MCRSGALQCAAVNGVLALLTAHDADPRLADAERKARVAALYLPLLPAALDALPQLYRGFNTNKGRCRSFTSPAAIRPPVKRSYAVLC